jgi:hypothetical protein
MLTRFKSRRLIAVLTIAGMTNAAGFLAAQAPVGGRTPTAAGGADQNKPELIANCDVTQTSCGGDPVLGGGGTFGGYTPPEASKPECWTGTSRYCGSDTAFTCAQWVVVSGSGSASGNVGPGTAGGSVGAGVTRVCGSYVKSVRVFYWSK